MCSPSCCLWVKVPSCLDCSPDMFRIVSMKRNDETPAAAAAAAATAAAPAATTTVWVNNATVGKYDRHKTSQSSYLRVMTNTFNMFDRLACALYPLRPPLLYPVIPLPWQGHIG